MVPTSVWVVWADFVYEILRKNQFSYVTVFLNLVAFLYAYSLKEIGPLSLVRFLRVSQKHSSSCTKIYMGNVQETWNKELEYLV